VETLHQTYELIRTIVGRLAKVTPDIKKSPDLEITLLELDKFSRKASKSYRTRLSDDLLSELSDMLTPFNLDIEDDEDIQYVKSVATAQPAGTWDDPAPLSAQPSRGSTAIAGAAKPAVKPKNAFEEMMRRAGGSVTPSSSPASIKARSSAQQSTSSSKQQPEVVEVDDDDFDDGFLDDISAADLDTLEQGAKSSASTPAKPKTATPAWKVPPRPPAGQQALKFLPKMTSSSTAAGQKLNINVTPRAPPKPAATTSFKSQFMKDARLQHRQAHLQRDRNIGGITPKTPAASGLGTGLGAYQGPRKPVKPLDSGSSASESSDEERQGVRALAARQKSPKKVVRAPQPERRRMQVLGGDMSELLRQREDKRAAQHNLKMRLKPDLNGLYRYVLAWDPDHTGQQPPHPPQYAREIGALGQVPTTFGDCTQYRKVMLPLFLQELWMQCLKDTSNAGYLPVEVASRAYEDDFLDMEITVLGNMPNDFRVNETDVVVLRCLGTNTKAVLAKVQGFRRKFGKDGAIKLRILSSCDQRELGVKSRWHLQKHVS
jgi:senataxin